MSNSGRYTRIAQHDDEDHIDDAIPNEDLQNEPTSPPWKADTPSPSHRRLSSLTQPPNIHAVTTLPPHQDKAIIDMDVINTRFQDWTHAMASKFKKLTKKKNCDIHNKEILSSVFEPMTGLTPAKEFRTLDHREPLTADDFIALVDSVRGAILKGHHPRMISKGSSGSYFALDLNDNIVGVFKPKDEEPYGKLNPKWTKWIHRNLCPCFFGRGCLIPNLSYMSEAGASLLDRRLKLNIVPYTQIVHLSSSAFFYDYLDRRAARKKQKPKPLPLKIGSFQTFMTGYKDASEFLRDNPWPDRSQRSYWGTYSYRDDTRSPSLSIQDEEVNGISERFVWTPDLKKDFIEQLQKLVLLDYLMRNTDRGLDNWMIKYCRGDEGSNHEQGTLNCNQLIPLERDGEGSRESLNDTSFNDIRKPHIHIAAIDNSLSFPFKHPDSWRSFTYGWLFLPQSLIGQPWTETIRRHFLSLLTSPEWWQKTIQELRELFITDTDFNERMFAKQIAVMKGQGFNIVESLKNKGDSPLDLVQLPKLIVVDEEIEVADIRFGFNESNRPLYNDTNGEDNQIIKTTRTHRSLSLDGHRPDLESLGRITTRPGRERRQHSEMGTSLSQSVEMLHSLDEAYANEEEMENNKSNFTWASKFRSRFSLDAGSWRRHRRSSSHDPEDSLTKMMIVERIEIVKANPLLTCW